MLKLTESVARWAAIIGGASLLAVSFVVAFDVLVRKLLSITLGGADEFSGYVFAISTSWALSYTLLNRGHIRIDIGYNYMRARGKAWFDLLSLIALGGVAMLILWYGYGVLQRSIELGSKSNTPLATPLWMPQLLWVAGLALFVWTLCLLFFHSIRAMIAGDYATISRLSGIPSIDDDVKAALDEAAAATERS